MKIDIASIEPVTVPGLNNVSKIQRRAICITDGDAKIGDRRLLLAIPPGIVTALEVEMFLKNALESFLQWR